MAGDEQLDFQHLDRVAGFAGAVDEGDWFAGSDLDLLTETFPARKALSALGDFGDFVRDDEKRFLLFMLFRRIAGKPHEGDDGSLVTGKGSLGQHPRLGDRFGISFGIARHLVDPDVDPPGKEDEVPAAGGWAGSVRRGSGSRFRRWGLARTARRNRGGLLG